MANFTVGDTFLAMRSTTRAAARISSMRLLVQEPMNTLSTMMASIAVFGVSAM